MAQLEYTYSTHALPCPRTAPSPPADLSSLAKNYAAIRLEALRTAPKAFGSTHAIESAFTPDQWATKVWRDDAVVLVCVAHPRAPPVENPPSSILNGSEGSVSTPTALDGLWVGSAILRGPLSAPDYALPLESGTIPVGSDDEETRWQMTAVFGSAAHRGRGLGKMLIQAGKDYARTQTGGAAGRVRLRVLVHPDNLSVLGLYSAMGFVDAGRVTGQEAYRTNGDLSEWELKLQTLSDEEKVGWQTQRVGVIMEWIGESP